MLLSAMSVLVVAQSSSEIPEVLMNNPVFVRWYTLTVVGQVLLLYIQNEYNPNFI